MSESDYRKLRREFIVSLTVGVLLSTFTAIYAYGKKSQQINDNTEGIEETCRRLDRIEDKIDKIYGYLIED